MSNNLYLEFGDSSSVNPPLGFAILGNAFGKVTQSLVIQKERNFAYHNKRYTAALDSGKISQGEYDAIINNQTESRQVYLFNSNLDIEKQQLIDLAKNFNLQGVEYSGTANEIVEDIINQGYQVVCKI